VFWRADRTRAGMGAPSGSEAGVDGNVRDDELVPYEEILRQGGELMLREASAYFAGHGRLHTTLRRLVERLGAEDIPYALLGGFALAEHGYPRLTEDIDLLLTPAGLERFYERLVGRGYRPAFPGARTAFRDTETEVRIEFVISGQYPGDGLPKPVAFPDPSTPGVTEEVDGIQVLALDKLIEVKLAAGQSAPNRLRDLADVQDLITHLGLSRAFVETLDPSVRDTYHDLWDSAQSSQGKLSQKDT
jgi:Uncharacterised nucleotidyltransferase